MFCQDDITVLRQARLIFRREFMEIGNIEDFPESFTIAFGCNKVMGKRFLKPHTIDLIHAGGYSCSDNYIKRALMWLVHKEQTDVCRKMHARNGREHRLPELSNFSVDGYCAETRTVYETFSCFYQGHTCHSFRDVITISGETFAERYKRTMTRLEHITRAVYQVRIQWECEFDEAGIVQQTAELLTHPIVEQSPLNTRCALYGHRTEDIRLHYKVREDETIQYVVMRIYPYICKYFKFPAGHPVSQVGDACKDNEA